MARLLLSTAEGTQTIELRAVNSLGRHPNNSIQLLDKIVSKEHCIIEAREGHFVLRDLGSLNGTYVNGERVQGEKPLRHGDEIALGSTRARYDDGTGQPVALPLMGPGAAIAGGRQADPTSASMRGAQPFPQQPPGYQPSHAPPAGAPYSSPHGGVRAFPQVGPSPYPGAQASPYGAPVHPSMQPQPPPAPRPVHPPAQSGGTAPFVQPPNPLPQASVTRRNLAGTRVDMLEAARSIGTQIAAQTKGFLAFDQIAGDPQQLRVDYERLRISWELSRDIGVEREIDPLLQKVLRALFKFVKADRGVILLRDTDGSLQPRSALRRDGTDTPIQVSSTILNHVINERAGVLTHDAGLDFANAKGKSMILNRISSAIVAPLLYEKDVLGAIWLDSESLAQFQAKDLEIMTAVANQAAMFIENTLLAKKIEQEIVTRERFSRLLSPNVAEQVISGKLEVKKGGIAVPECTVFNSDIRGFTTMSEGAEASEMVDLLNEYFELMVETIFKYEGTLDKFMGDGIMALWGAPVTHPDDPVRCVQSALDQMEVLGRFNRKLIDAGKQPLAIGIGIHTGPLVSGYVGSSKALSYTVIGDTANTSARLCGIALAGQVIVSENTYKRLGDRFEVEELPAAHLKGKEKPMRIYDVKREKVAR